MGKKDAIAFQNRLPRGMQKAQAESASRENGVPSARVLAAK